MFTAEKVIGFVHSRSPERLVEEDVQFQVTKPGKHTFEIYAMCDSYAGIDKRIEVTFHGRCVQRSSFCEKLCILVEQRSCVGLVYLQVLIDFLTVHVLIVLYSVMRAVSVQRLSFDLRLTVSNC